MVADKITQKQRSYIMSRIRSKWTEPERIAHAFLKGHKIRHKMHPKLQGSPDIVLKDRKVAIFLHGCFWHGCKRCYKKPKHNRIFWGQKITANKLRDKKNSVLLKSEGWTVFTIWEHEIKDGNISKILSVIK